MEWIKKQQLKVKFLSFINNPEKTNKIFEMVDIASSMRSHEEEMIRIESYLLSNNAFKEMVNSHWIPRLPKMNFLENCEKETLGSAYLKHLSDNNLDIDFFPKIKINRPVDYLTYRTYVCHDLWHTLLGYDTTPVGEIEVQAFSLGQIKSGMALMIMSAGFIHLLENDPHLGIQAFEAATKAYERGKQSDFLLAHKLEDMLELPIDEVRKIVGLAS